ncbi:hypothetical protein JRQ81_019621 [Phrynocephalus forsythii]|uniref:Uncharacterized protein n=1 Tax=Phrynocephalus forsythii TaxID=171643 RepID=A0A9Q0XM92_9SAUR|nr:hypothetical protein JRQ81_019621 [Phrynocephalus forsythii]
MTTHVAGEMVALSGVPLSFVESPGVPAPPQTPGLLREKQDDMGMADYVIVQDMPTRWNSTLDMIACLVEQKGVLEAMMSNTPILPGGRELDITATNWLTLSQMVDILKPFKETTMVL